MWTSMCSFLFRRLFSKSETEKLLPGSSRDSPVYGKRLKMSHPDYDSSGSLNQSEIRERFVKQALEKFKYNDGRGEGRVVAEIVTEKAAGPSSSAIEEHADVPQEENRVTNYVFSLQRPTYQKTIDCTSDIALIAKSLKKHFKFFNTPRSDPTKKKHKKSKKDRKSCIKRMSNSRQQGHQLKEKKQYGELQPHISNSSAPVTPSSSHHQENRSETEGAPIVDLTTEKTSVGEMRSNSTSNIVRTKPSEEDVQCIKQVPQPQMHRESCIVIPANAKKPQTKVLNETPKSSSEVLKFNGSKNNAIILSDSEDDEEKESHSGSLEERLNASMHISNPPTTEVQKKDPYLGDLTLEQQERIKNALKAGSSQEVLIEKFGLKITRHDMSSLADHRWVNDDVINFYMNLIMNRNKENSTLPEVYAFNTFFYPKLVAGGHSCVKKWTKKVDIFVFDIILIPLHLGLHWCLGVIDFRSQTVKFYDSIGGKDKVCLESLLAYLAAEKLDKKSERLNVEAWTKRNERDIPHQLNGNDCGVFTCVFAEHVARDSLMLFDQRNMFYFRRKIILELLDGKLLNSGNAVQ